MSEGVVPERVTVVDGAHECDITTVEFNPIKGCTFECGGCGDQFPEFSVQRLPRFCRSCGKVLRFCEQGFPRDFLKKAVQYG
ncbi:MAG: hypothetical protein AMXMBFR44_2130 [Candidatus Campbellbacteria bacterium]